LILTEAIRSAGIPTVEPIGAIHQSIFYPFYEAYFLSLEIPQAVDLIRFFQKIGSSPSPENLALKRRTIRSVGPLLRQFHQAGFFHRDLQLKNILVANGQPFLIDFDRSYRKEFLSTREKIKNILRLNRSVEKWNRRGLPISRTDRWRFFLAYSENDQTIRKTIQKTLRKNALRSFFHRLGWAFQK
jgi:3-deoxy-D-manno-octulosonic acid kinase